MIQKKKRYFWPFIALVSCVIVLSCVFISVTLAWLERNYTRNSQDLVLGDVKLEMYANGSKINGNVVSHTNGGPLTWQCTNPYAVPKGQKQRNLNLKIRNSGNIDALIRANIRIYMLGENNQQINLLLGEPGIVPTIGTTKPYKPIIKVALNSTGWLQDFPNNNQIASGYMYLNSKLLPYNVNGTNVAINEIPIITQIVVPTGYENEDIYVSLSVDAIAYAGNIYRKINQLSPSNITLTKRIETDTKKYFTFQSPSGFNDQIPVKAFPFGKTLPENWTIWQ